MELSLQSACRAASDFELADGDLAHVARICRLVEGMPLGILLAMGWVGVLGLAEIAAEIEQGLDFLESAWSDFPARHRSLRRVFAYSWNLLAPRERDVLARLSIFRGSFSLQAARQVGGAPRDARRLEIVDRAADAVGNAMGHEPLVLGKFLPRPERIAPSSTHR